MTKPRNCQPDWGRAPVKFDVRLLSHHQPAPQNRVLVWAGDWAWGYWNGQCFEDEDGYTIFDAVMWAYLPLVPETVKGGEA